MLYIHYFSNRDSTNLGTLHVEVLLVGMASDHYSFVNPYCSCILSDDPYPYISYRPTSLRHQQIGLLHHPYVIARAMRLQLLHSTVLEYLVLRTDLCIVMWAHASRVRMHITEMRRLTIALEQRALGLGCVLWRLGCIVNGMI